MELRKYRVVYADPPWNFAAYSLKGKGMSAEAHYNTMPLADIKRVDLASITEDDCVLLMWVADPFIKQAMEVVEAWGFTYKTVGFYWIKTGSDGVKLPIGNGYWTRANPEQCWLATKGHPKRLNADVRKLIVSPRREHSRKPDEVYDAIERLCPGPYLEVFARQRRGGEWTSWGDQVDAGPTERRWHSRFNDRSLRPPPKSGWWRVPEKG